MYTEFERVVSVLVVGRGPPHCKSRHYLSVPTLLPRLLSVFDVRSDGAESGRKVPSRS